MRRILATALLSLFLITGTGTIYADHHKGGHEKGRKEQRVHNKRHGEKAQHRQPMRPEPPKRHKNMPPAPPRHYNHAYHYPHYSVHDNLAYMVGRIAGGARDVNVWQVDPRTYVVRYNLGGRLYTQYIYPYEGRYGRRNSITVNWSPLSPWTLIPSVHLNINI